MISIFVLTTVLVYVFALPVIETEIDSDPNNYKNIEILSLESAIDQDGRYSFSFENDDGSKLSQKGDIIVDDEHAIPSVRGSYSYNDVDGQPISLTYTADENGFRPVGAHLPTPPPIPPEILKSLRFLATAKPFVDDQLYDYTPRTKVYRGRQRGRQYKKDNVVPTPKRTYEAPDLKIEDLHLKSAEIANATQEQAAKITSDSTQSRVEDLIIEDLPLELPLKLAETSVEQAARVILDSTQKQAADVVIDDLLSKQSLESGEKTFETEEQAARVTSDGIQTQVIELKIEDRSLELPLKLVEKSEEQVQVARVTLDSTQKQVANLAIEDILSEHTLKSAEKTSETEGQPVKVTSDSTQTQAVDWKTEDLSLELPLKLVVPSEQSLKSVEKTSETEKQAAQVTSNSTQTQDEELIIEDLPTEHSSKSAAKSFEIEEQAERITSVNTQEQAADLESAAQAAISTALQVVKESKTAIDVALKETSKTASNVTDSVTTDTGTTIDIIKEKVKDVTDTIGVEVTKTNEKIAEVSDKIAKEASETIEGSRNAFKETTKIVSKRILNIAPLVADIDESDVDEVEPNLNFEFLKLLM